MLALTGQRWRELERVNAEVNGRVNYKSDVDLYGIPEFWTIAAGAGDCEDYALAKRGELLALGWPVEALRLAVCLDERGRGHAVLTVDTSKGVYVLDNRSPFVQPWKALSYTWVKRQAAGGKAWVTITAQART